MSLPESYDGLLAYADAAFADARARWPASFACRANCSGCCHVHLQLLPIEAARVRTALAEMDADLRARIRGQAVRMSGTDPICPLLIDGRCSIYAARPLVCRTQGMPLRFGRATEVCALNFTAGPPPREASIDADAVNDQLVAIDFFTRRRPGVAVSVVEVIADVHREEKRSANHGEASA